MAAARGRAAEDGMAFCHPFDDPAVVAGQGTLGLELVEDVADLACVVIPLGGGGLASGVAIAVKSQRPDVRVIGVQAGVCAPYAGGRVPDRAGRHPGRRHRREAPGPADRPARRAVARRRRRRRRGRHRRRHGAADGPGQALRRGRRRGRRRCGPDRSRRPAHLRHHVHRAVRGQRRPRRRAGPDPSSRDRRRPAPRRHGPDRRPPRQPGPAARACSPRPAPTCSRSTTSARASTCTCARPACTPRSRCAGRDHAATVLDAVRAAGYGELRVDTRLSAVARACLPTGR